MNPVQQKRVKSFQVVFICSIFVLFCVISSFPNQFSTAKAHHADNSLASALATNLSFGETITGSISVSGEIDVYTFEAEPGDVILIGASKMSGNLWPRIRLFGLDNDLINEVGTHTHVEMVQTLPNNSSLYIPFIASNNSAAGINTDTSPIAAITANSNVAKTYTIFISDAFNGTFVGDYALYIQRLNAPSNITELTYASTITDMITLPAEMDTYTFTVAAGDTVIFGMSGEDVWPQMRLYDSDGMMLNEVGTHTYVEMVHTFSAAGDYALLLSDAFNGTFIGDYNLYLQRLNNPQDATPIAFGQTFSSTITLSAEQDTYSFTSEAGDKILFGMSGNDVWSKIRLYDTDGNLLSQTGTHTFVEMTKTLSVAGDYTLLLGDAFNGTFTGVYHFHMQRLNNPVNASNLSYGNFITSTIDLPAEVGAYTFTAGANDTVLISMNKISGVWPRVRLYTPDGNLLAEVSDLTHVELIETLTVSGTYLILCSDSFNGTFTGNYNLLLQKIP